MVSKMKLIVLVSILFIACRGERTPIQKTAVRNIEDRDFYTYEIDGCEYFGNLGGDSRDDFLTHKGNCRNPIHSKSDTVIKTY